MRGKSGRYLIGVCVFLCCMTTVGHAIDQNTVLNATVFIDTDISNGTGFYVTHNLIATSFNLVSDATWIDAYWNGYDIGVIGVVAYDARRNLAILQVNTSRTPLRLSNMDEPEPYETIYISAGLSKTDKRLRSEQTVPHRSRDFCQAGVKFPIIVGIDSDGGPVLDIYGAVRGVFFIGMFEYEKELAELNYSFIVPVKYLRNLIHGSLSVKATPIAVEGDYCTLISKANAKIRKAKQSGYIDAQRLRKLAKADLEKAAKLFTKAKKIPWWKRLKLLSKIL